MESELPVALAEAMRRLWAQHNPRMCERIAALEAAATALENGGLSQEDRTQASAAAHQLAGSLGTFGLHQGTLLAREAVSLLSAKAEANIAPTTAAAARLAELAAQLRCVVRNHQ